MAQNNKKSATFNQYEITIEDSGSIVVTHNGDVTSNTKEALRKIASECSFDYDDKWTTRQFGKKLLEHIITSKSSDCEAEDEEDDDKDNENPTFTLEQQLAAICVYMAGVDGEEITKNEALTFNHIAESHPDLIDYYEAGVAWKIEQIEPSDIDEVVYSVTNTTHQKFLYFAATYIAFSDNHLSTEEQHLLSLMAKIWELGEFANETINKLKSIYKTAIIEEYWRDKYDTIIERDELSGFVVVKDEKFGFVDLEGKELISPRYTRVCDGINGAYAVQYNDKWGFVDFSGQEIVAPQYEDYNVLRCGFIAIEKGEKWGVYNNDFNIIIPIEYNRIGELLVTDNDRKNTSIICAHKGEIMYQYNQDGKFLFEVPYII